MSFRKEEKLHIYNSQLLNLLNWVYENGGYKLYESRIVSSTYLDNDEMKMFEDSEEGCVPRKKIRIRSYDRNEHQLDKSALEIKTSSVEGRYKTTNKDFDLKKIMSIGFFDKDYGICKPRVRVTYEREYYKIHDVRLTVDRNIEYLKLNTRGRGIYKKHDPDIIVEVKAEDYVPIEYLFKKFHFDRIRFSKYSKAINSFLG
tara:strand:- start:186 stop:788 length:603 start_codon:yes stop_codon:yes gene_type:complete